MSELFNEALAVAGAIGICVVSVIIVLNIFFKIMGRFDSRRTRTGVINIKGVIEGDTPVDVHLNDGEKLLRVRMRKLEINDYSPMFTLHEMLVFELEQGGFIMVRVDNIKRIDLLDCKNIVMKVDLDPSRGML